MTGTAPVFGLTGSWQYTTGKTGRRVGERFCQPRALIIFMMMDALIPPDVSAELTQILSNLVLGDNEIRSKSVFSTLEQPFSLTTRLARKLS
jgi:hypothetical protein